MKIELNQIKVSDIFNGYQDQQENGVYAYGGKLSIRPPYQREFVYNEKQRNSVIDTLKKGFPLNVMYWVKNGDTYELLDGQQRTLSICQYLSGDFAFNYQYFKGLTKDEQEQILNYELQIYVCEGTDKEKLEWFRVINVAGEALTDQELLNAAYTGSWLASAKEKFSKSNGPAYRIGKDYMKGSPIRQEYLETVLSWINDGDVADYMAKHQTDDNANELWVYFQNVINWVKIVFPNYRKEMKGLPWGKFYNQYKNNVYDPDSLETDVKALIKDDDVTKKSGIYEYLLSNKTLEKALNIRTFSDSQKQKKYEEQGGICPICGEHYEYSEMEGDHIIPWRDGGKTDYDNLQMLCKKCNRTKGGK